MSVAKEKIQVLRCFEPIFLPLQFNIQTKLDIHLTSKLEITVEEKLTDHCTTASLCNSDLIEAKKREARLCVFKFR